MNVTVQRGGLDTSAMKRLMSVTLTPALMEEPAM